MFTLRSQDVDLAVLAVFIHHNTWHDGVQSFGYFAGVGRADVIDPQESAATSGARQCGAVRCFGNIDGVKDCLDQLMLRRRSGD